MKSYPDGEAEEVSNQQQDPASIRLSQANDLAPPSQYGSIIYQEPSLFDSNDTENQTSYSRQMSSSSILTEASDTTPLIKCQEQLATVQSPQNNHHEDDRPWASLFSDVMLFPFTFWLVCAICILLYGTVIPFNNIASDFLMSKWYPGDTEMAGLVMR
jgi:hypothetical protein